MAASRSFIPLVRELKEAVDKQNTQAIVKAAEALVEAPDLQDILEREE